jgi:lysylphosphatidylglycerol synthetase-like protein (DUF2156 family)
MESVIFLLVALLVLTGLECRRRQVGGSAGRPVRRWLHVLALVLTALYAFFFAIFGFGEIFSGDLNGAIHLAPMVMILLVLLIARQLPWESGVVLSALGVLIGLSFRLFRSGDWSAVLLLAVPWLVIGLVLLAAVWLAPRHKEARPV